MPAAVSATPPSATPASAGASGGPYTDDFPAHYLELDKEVERSQHKWAGGKGHHEDDEDAHTAAYDDDTADPDGGAWNDEA